MATTVTHPSEAEAPAAYRAALADARALGADFKLRFIRTPKKLAAEVI